MGRIVDSSDRALWDGFNADLIEVAGTEARLYSLRADQGRDPLYGEAKMVFADPVDIMVSVRQPDREGNIGERGSERIQKTQVWFSRALLESAQCPTPKEGDVLSFWGGHYDLAFPTDESLVPTGPSPDEIQLVFDATRRERFLPERKTGGTMPPDPRSL